LTINRITWHPVVITFASKDSRRRAPQVHALDIKTSNEFVHGQTTHVLSQKRNLPLVLEGLVAGVHIATTHFIDALTTVATPQDTNPDNYKASKLEEDFDAWWPKEKEYIPPVGAEPVPRPEQMLEPDPRRSELFSGLTFVFLNEHQYSTLGDVISSGGGKSLFYDIKYGETTVEEYVDFVRNVAGEKARSKANNDRLPVITVRLSTFPDGMLDWAENLVFGVDQALNQRSIQQNEFLDAIVTNDTSSLQRPPPEINSEAASSLPAAKENAESSLPERSSESKSKDVSQVSDRAQAQAPDEDPPKVIPRKRPIRRGITQSRFTGFDDYEPPPKVRKTQEDSIMDDVKASQPTQSIKVSQPTQTAQLQSQAAVSSTQRSQRRPSPVVETIEVIDDDELYPAAAAIRKRRAATRGVSGSVEPEASAVSIKTQTRGEKLLEHLQKAKGRIKNDINVREQTKLRLQEQEEQRKADEERLREALEGVDISDIRGLVQVEEMEVKPRQHKTAQPGTQSGERWNDEWNGRKNFKKFRRRGTERGPQPQRVIVALQEVSQKKGFGHGDAFFLEQIEKAKPSRDERPTKPTTARAQESESEAEHGFTRRNRKENPEVINVEDSDMEDQAEMPESAPSTLRSRTQRVAETQATDTQSQTQRKRGPATVATGQPPAKRARPGRHDDDSDAEETGFRLRRRR
jgi:hypothetical protein